MMRRLLQPLWVLLAIVFLIEAWLWDHLEPIVARLVGLIPLNKFKRWLSGRIAALSPPMTLIVFVVPIVLLFPLKLLGLWLLARQEWASAVATIIFAKLLGVGVTAFIFDVTRPKLLQMGWFRRFYDIVIDLRARAHALAAPIMSRIMNVLQSSGDSGSFRMFRLIQRFRKRVR